MTAPALTRGFPAPKLSQIRRIFPWMEVVSPNCGCFSTMILRDLILFSKWLFILCMKSFCSPLGSVIRGQLTACVRVVGKVIDCHERIRDHLENGPLRLLVCSADLQQCCRAFIIS